MVALCTAAENLDPLSTELLRLLLPSLTFTSMPAPPLLPILCRSFYRCYTIHATNNVLLQVGCCASGA